MSDFTAIPEQCRLQLCLCYADDVCQKCGALANEHKSWKPAPGMDRKRPEPEPVPPVAYEAEVRDFIRCADALRSNLGSSHGSKAYELALVAYDAARAKLGS